MQACVCSDFSCVPWVRSCLYDDSQMKWLPKLFQYNKNSEVRNWHKNLVSTRTTKSPLVDPPSMFFLIHQLWKFPRIPLLTSCPSLADFLSPLATPWWSWSANRWLCPLIHGSSIGTMEWPTNNSAATLGLFLFCKIEQIIISRKPLLWTQ